MMPQRKGGSGGRRGMLGIAETTLDTGSMPGSTLLGTGVSVRALPAQAWCCTTRCPPTRSALPAVRGAASAAHLQLGGGAHALPRILEHLPSPQLGCFVPSVPSLQEQDWPACAHSRCRDLILSLWRPLLELESMCISSRAFLIP